MAYVVYSYEQLLDMGIAAFIASLVKNNVIPEGQLSVASLRSGSAIRALLEAEDVQQFFIQLQNAYIYNFSRMQTCVGPDLLSWFAQFGFTPPLATPATGAVSITLPASPLQTVTYSVGTIIQTAVTPTVQYQLIADPSQSSYNPSTLMYQILPGQTSITATVQAVIPGTASNLPVGALDQFAASSQNAIVTNLLAISNGQDAASDALAISLWLQYFASRSLGTLGAISAAISDINLGLPFVVQDTQEPNGGPVLGNTLNPLGMFSVLLSSNSGTVTSSDINIVSNTVLQVKGAGIQAAIYSANVQTLTLTIPIYAPTLASGGSFSTSFIQATQNTVASYINNLGFSPTIYTSVIANLITQSNTAVVAVQTDSITYNGTAASSFAGPANGTMNINPTSINIVVWNGT